jgi:hypothetical protein
VAIWFRRCSSWEEEEAADREYWLQFTPDERVAMIEDLRGDWASMTTSELPAISRDQADLFALFERHGVRALVVGAYAIAHHAKPRFTKDLHIFVDPSRENAERVVAALTEFGFGAVGITVEELAAPGCVIQLGYPPRRIDIFTSISGVTFAEAWANRVEGTLRGHRLIFIGKADLLRNKEASRRPQDLADADLLRRF